MKAIPTKLSGVTLLEPKIFSDSRGFFFESYNSRVIHELLGFDGEFVQDNHSRSTKNVLRGMHYQLRQPQGKLVRTVRGRIFDVTIDLRRSSPTYKQWQGIELSEENHRELWIPPGFAHGFLALSDSVDFLYKTTSYYAPGHEHCLLWNDPAIGVKWPLEGNPVLSAKDMEGLPLSKLETFD